MTREVAFRREAQREFDESADFYERRRAGLKAEFIAEIQRVLDRIAKSPYQFAEVHEDVREVLTDRFPFAINFRVLDQQIRVLSVFHTSRDPQIWQSRN